MSNKLLLDKSESEYFFWEIAAQDFTQEKGSLIID